MSIVLDAQGAVPTRIKLLPAGKFKARDGRPASLLDVKAQDWFIDDQFAAKLIARFEQNQADTAIDYEHQMLAAKTNGQPSPAAGWFSKLEYISGDGLYAIDVRWTERAAAMLKAGEYKYISPVFVFNPDTGEVYALLNFALTNNPALDFLPPLAALSAQFAALGLGDSTLSTTKENSTMQRLAILKAIGLDESTSDDSALTAIAALRTRTDSLAAQVTALQANQFDPAKHIPLVEHQKVSDQLAALSVAADKATHESLMTAALSDARILPANEAYWRAQSVAVLSAFLKDAKPLAALSGTQTGGKEPGGDGKGVALSAEEQWTCKQLGLSHEDFNKSKAKLA